MHRGTRAALAVCMTKHLAELLAASAAFLSACSSSDAVDGKSIVLVHGAWMGAWAWDDVKADLEARGATVTAVELPAHGADQTPLPSVTLRSYIDTVEAGARCRAQAGDARRSQHGRHRGHAGSRRARRSNRPPRLRHRVRTQGRRLAAVAQHAGSGLRARRRNRGGDGPRNRRGRGQIGSPMCSAPTATSPPPGGSRRAIATNPSSRSSSQFA